MDRWPLRKAYFWEYAPFFRVVVPFVVGIAVHELYHSQAWNLNQTLLVVLLSFVVLVFLAKRKANSMQPLFFIAIQCLLVYGGYSIAYINDVGHRPSLYRWQLERDATCVVRVSAVPSDKEHTWKVPVEVIRTIKDGIVTHADGAAILYIYKDELPMLYGKGDTLLVPGKWEDVQNADNPYEFDHARYLRHNNIYSQQFCAVRAVRLYAVHDGSDESVTEQMHNRCMKQLEAYIGNAQTKGLIQAMLIGDEVNIDEDMRQSFTETGIVHVIAISGGNVMMFFTVIGWLLWWVKNKKYKWLNYVIALPLVWFYVVMAGASPSAIRAAIMFSLLAGGILLSKNNNALNQLLATAFVLLCAQPNWLFFIGVPVVVCGGIVVDIFLCANTQDSNWVVCTQ